MIVQLIWIVLILLGICLIYHTYKNEGKTGLGGAIFWFVVVIGGFCIHPFVGCFLLIAAVTVPPSSGDPPRHCSRREDHWMDY